MVEQQENAQKPRDILKVGLTRRQAVQAAGLAAVGLTFGKPIIQTFYPKPAFANYHIADSTSTNLADTSDPGSYSSQGHVGNPTSHGSPSSSSGGKQGGKKGTQDNYSGNGHAANNPASENPKAQGPGTPNGNGNSSPGGGYGGQGGQSLARENPKGGPLPDPTAVVKPLGNNLTRLGEFSNRSKKWNFYDPHLPLGGSNQIQELVSGQVYLIDVKANQQVMLNGKLRNLFAGANYIVW
jgi:hypothetical protein